MQELIEKVESYIKKKDSVMRKAISIDDGLSLTLRFLATGHSFIDLKADFKIHRTTISAIVIELFNAIYDCLKDEYLKIPQTKEDQKLIAQKTQAGRQFSNCIGAADGKHISILDRKDSILSQSFTIIKVYSAL